MFQDGRSKKVVFVAHCFLNQNSISDGTAVYPAAFKEMIHFFLNQDIGIVQMPCPELCCLGLDRGNVSGADSPVVVENTRIRREMKKSAADYTLGKLADHVLWQISEYHRHGFEIIGIIGANRSPNCGVNTTSDHNMEIDGKGLFMEKLSEGLAREHITVPMIGLKGSDDIVKSLDSLLSDQRRNKTSIY